MKHHTTSLAAAIMVLSLLGTTTTAKAQSATANATVTVMSSMTVTVNRDLAFPMQTTGSAGVVVAPTTGPEAAMFTLLGQPNAEVTIEFTSLPTELTHTGIPTNTIPISFSAVSAAFSTINDQGGATSITPGSISTHSLASTTGNLFVWIGGTLGTIPITHPIGTYTGTITLEAAYTGN